MTIITDFDLGDMVYLKTDPEQKSRQITQISVRPHNCLLYELGYNGNSTWHYDIEFTTDKDMVKLTE